MAHESSSGAAGTVVSVNVGQIVQAPWAGRMKRTAIDKRAVSGPVAVGELGLEGDRQADTAHHGGVDQAVYAYAREDLDMWESALGRELHAGVFGENLTTRGIDLCEVLVGERWRVGDVLLEATLPREPCGVFQAWLGERGWVRRFTQEARSGAYFRVLAPGTVTAGDTVAVVHRPGHAITLADGFRARYSRDADLLRRIADLPGSSPKWAHKAEKARVRPAAPAG